MNAAYRLASVTTTRGRRRDPHKDEAILVATRELLVEVGYAALSMEAVASRAAVSKPTLYLRHQSKAVLVFEAVFGKTKSRAVPDSGSVVDDLREAYQWAVEEFAAPEAMAALPGLLGELAAHPELAELVRTTVIEPEYARVRAALERGQERGEIRRDVDLELVIDAFTGTALARSTLLAHAVVPCVRRGARRPPGRGVAARPLVEGEPGAVLREAEPGQRLRRPQHPQSAALLTGPGVGLGCVRGVVLRERSRQLRAEPVGIGAGRKRGALHDHRLAAALEVERARGVDGEILRTCRVVGAPS